MASGLVLTLLQLVTLPTANASRVVDQLTVPRVGVLNMTRMLVLNQLIPVNQSLMAGMGRADFDGTGELLGERETLADREGDLEKLADREADLEGTGLPEGEGERECDGDTEGEREGMAEPDKLG